MFTAWLTTFIDRIARSMPADSWLSMPLQVRALLAILLLSVICGTVGALVVGNRMAFLSDALAHCAFAGVTVGLLLSFAGNFVEQQDWMIPTVMVSFGILVGLAIAFVRENTSLASDTIIGVFFAFAVGLGVMMMGALRRNTYLTPESFLFGSILATEESDIIVLMGLMIANVVVIGFSYNAIVFASFNPSLARSRGIRVRLCNYVLIVLLALIVNLCIKVVGALLINALLVVPAAAAANIARSSRSMFWWTVAVTLSAGLLGLFLGNVIEIPIGRGDPLPLQIPGAIVLLCVGAFFVSMTLRMIREQRRPALPI